MHPNRLHPAARRVNPVTICIGFLHHPKEKGKPSLILASDSRISVGNNITNDAKKISFIRFKDRSVLIAKAGYRHSFARFEEIFRDKAAVAEITGYRTVATVAEDSIRELQRELLDRQSGEALKRLNDSYCEFIIAYFHDGKAYIYTLDLIARIAERVDGDFVAIGNGAILANFLLTSIDVKNLKGGELEAAISVIEMCKLHDSSCGGPCKMAMLTPGARIPIMVDSAEILSISRKMNFTKKAHAALLKKFANNFKSENESDARFDIDLKKLSKLEKEYERK